MSISYFQLNRKSQHIWLFLFSQKTNTTLLKIQKAVSCLFSLGQLVITWKSVSNTTIKLISRINKSPKWKLHHLYHQIFINPTNSDDQQQQNKINTESSYGKRIRTFTPDSNQTQVLKSKLINVGTSFVFVRAGRGVYFWLYASQGLKALRPTGPKFESWEAIL